MQAGGLGTYQNQAYQDPEMAQLAAMLGLNNSNNGNMSGFSAYLPYMMSQGGANPEIQKQMIQSMMMSQMMPGMGGF